MLDEQKILSIVSTVSEKIKNGKKNKDGDCEYESIDWGKLYKEATEKADEVEVHACGDFPVKLIGYNFPNESDEEKEYRKKSFQPVTKPYWLKGIHSLNRIWSEQNYKIDWTGTEDYFLKEFPLYNSVVSFFKEVVTREKINDPNGVLVVDFDLPVKQNSEGQYVIDDSKEIAPYGTVYDSDDVLFFESNDFALFCAEEKSEVVYYDRPQKSGLVFYLYDNENIYRIYQIGKKTDWTFQTDLYYNHALGYLPCWKLKGVPDETIDSEVLYDSYFSPALPYLNEAIIVHSTNKAVRNKVSYPIRAYYEQKCNSCDGYGYSKEDSSKSCTTCKGTGNLKFSWGRDYVHELPTTTNNAGADQVPFPGIGYVSPDGAIINQNEEVIDKWIERAFTFMNLDVSLKSTNKNSSQDLTATSAKIDREELFVFLLQISNELFDLMSKFVSACYFIRYGKESTIQISYPKTFELTSASELTEEIKTANDASLPDSLKAELNVDYTEQRFAQQDNVTAKIKAIQYCDSLFVKSTQDIQILLSGGVIQKWQAVLHTMIDSYLNEELLKNENYLQNDLQKIKDDMTARAKADIVSSQPNTAGNILNNIASA